MSSPFYIWDAEVHAGLPQTIQQAEALAMQRPTEGIKSNKLAVWLNELNDFVKDPANSNSVDNKTIDAIQNMMEWLPRSQKPRLEIEHIHVEDSEYFYRELVQSVQRHNLAAYDFNRGLFISKDYMLPQGIQPILEQEFAIVTKLEPSVGFAVNAMPKNAKQFQNLIIEWFEQHDFKAQKFKVYLNDDDVLKFERENSLFYENLSMTVYYRGGSPYFSNRVTHGISVKNLYPIIGNDKSDPLLSLGEKIRILSHYSIYIDGLRREGVKFLPETRFLSDLELLQVFFDGLKNYLDIIADSLCSLGAFNHLINHSDDFGIKDGRKGKPGCVLPDLALAKLADDPQYNQLYVEKESLKYDIPVFTEEKIALLEKIVPVVG